MDAPVKFDKNGEQKEKKELKSRSKTKYDPKVFDRYLEACKKGMATVQFCAQEGISRQTFDNWIENYDALKEVKALGKAYAEAWWLNQGQEYLVIHNEHQGGTTKFNDRLYCFTVGGRFGHTADRETREALRRIEQRLDSRGTDSITAFAKEAECEDDNQA